MVENEKNVQEKIKLADNEQTEAEDRLASIEGQVRRYQDQNREFDEWAWRDIEEMPDLVVDFKKELYLKLIEKFSPIKDKIKSN